MDGNSKIIHAQNLTRMISTFGVADSAGGEERGYEMYDRVLRACELDDHADWIKQNLKRNRGCLE